MRDATNPISHWAAYPVRRHGIEFFTSEAACQAEAFGKDAANIVEEIRQAPSPRIAMEIALRNRKKIKRNWQRVRRRLVTRICMDKVTRHPEVRQALWETWGYPIKLDTKDPYWGLGTNGNGGNVAGAIMEQCRERLFREPYTLPQEEKMFADEY